MADVQILAAHTASAPEWYEVPNSQEIMPKAVSAIFDGTSASGDFVALCEIVSDAGIVVAQSPSATIAAGGSAEVSWFPGAEVEEAAAADAFVTETIFLPTWATSVSAGQALTPGQSYNIAVQGDYSIWTVALGTGSPQPDAMFPSSSGVARTSTQVGLDPDTCFAKPTGDIVPLGHNTAFEMNLGSGFTHVEPIGGPYSTPQSSFFYTYRVTGQGAIPAFRINDNNPTDNYGKLKIIIYGQTPGVQPVVVTDGTTSVGNLTELDFTSGATVTDGGSGTAQVAVSGGAPSGPAGGDLTGTYPNPTLGASGVSAGTYGDGTHVPQVTFDAKGRATSASNVAIAAGSGTVTSVASSDSSIVVTNPTTTPSLQLAALDTIATNEPPTGSWSNNSQKITNLANGSAVSDAAAFGQIPTSGSPSAGAASDVQVFGAGGGTWNMPAGTKVVEVVCIGAGGGGAGGFSGTGVASATSGGGAGGGGAVARAVFQAADVPSSVAVTVSSGGSGGGAGMDGGNATNTTFGSLLLAGGGGGGRHGTQNANVNGGGAGSVGGSAVFNSGAQPVASGAGISGQAASAVSNANGNVSEWGGASGAAGTSNSQKVGGSSIFGGPGGGSGGGTSSGGVGTGGGAGGTTQSYAAGGGPSGGSGGASTTAGGSGTFLGPYCGGGGGGGGGGNAGVTGGAGGAGGLGAGGGGGGACSNGTGGAGGNGGDGRCIVISY